MRYRLLITTAVLLMAGCTFSSQQDVLTAEFHPPFSYQSWTLKQSMPAKGRHVCELSSGYNGLTITISHGKKGERAAVKGNRTMIPGAEFIVNVNGQRFVTAENAFPPDTSAQMLDAFSHGGKAYLEWSELSGASDGNGRQRVQNIVRLDELNTKLDQCRAGF